MANENLKRALDEQRDRLLSINLEQVFRPNLGPVSLPEAYRELVRMLISRFEKAASVAGRVPNNIAQQIVSHSEAFRKQLEAIAAQGDDAYVAQKPQFQQETDSIAEQLGSVFSSVTQAIIEHAGILETSNAQTTDQLIENLRVDIRSQLPTLVEEEASRAITEARELAKSIESRARTTAAGISINDAQTQFNNATKSDGIQLLVWSALGVASLYWFFSLALLYTSEAKTLPNDWTWQFGYITALHATILAATGTIAGFSLKNLRASLHMLNHNLHRKRIANSIEAFVQAAQTPEQRDMILMRLVDSLTAFGQSGLVNSDSDHIQPKLSIDTISHALGGGQK